MRIAERKQIGTEFKTETVLVDNYDADGKWSGQHEEEREIEVQIFGTFYRDATPEEEAQAAADQAAAEEWERTRPRTVEEQIADLSAKLDALTTFQGLTVRDMGGGVFEVVKATSGAGTADEPFTYAAGIVLKPNAYYTYEGTRYVFVGWSEREAVDWATDAADMEAF